MNILKIILHYEYLDNGDIDPFLSYQNAVMKRWNEANRELLFVRTMDSGGWYDKNCIPRGLGINGVGAIGITQSLVDAFFMRNGQRPIIGYNSDGSPKVNPDANYSETGFSTQKETYSTKWQYGSSEGDRNKDENVVVDANTYKMYCDREPRFYNAVSFHGSWQECAKRPYDFFYNGKDNIRTSSPHDAPQNGYLVRKSLCMTDNKKIMLTFLWFGITGYVVILCRIEKSIFPSGQHLMYITLMRYIKNNLVFW